MSVNIHIQPGKSKQRCPACGAMKFSAHRMFGNVIKGKGYCRGCFKVSPFTESK